jgi:hypothetical protein
LGKITKRIKWPLGKTLKEDPTIPLTLEALLYMAYILVYNLLEKGQGEGIGRTKRNTQKIDAI